MAINRYNVTHAGPISNLTLGNEAAGGLHSSSYFRAQFKNLWEGNDTTARNMTIFFRGLRWNLYVNQPWDMWGYAAYRWWVTYFDERDNAWHDLIYCSELGDKDSATITYDGVNLRLSQSGCKIDWNRGNPPEGTTLWRMNLYNHRYPDYLYRAEMHFNLFGLSASPLASKLKYKKVTGIGDFGLESGAPYVIGRNLDNYVPIYNINSKFNRVSNGTHIMGSKEGCIQPPSMTINWKENM